MLASVKTGRCSPHYAHSSLVQSLHASILSHQNPGQCDIHFLILESHFDYGSLVSMSLTPCSLAIRAHFAPHHIGPTASAAQNPNSFARILWFLSTLLQTFQSDSIPRHFPLPHSVLYRFRGQPEKRPGCLGTTGRPYSGVENAHCWTYTVSD